METPDETAPMGPPPLPVNWGEMTGDEKYQYFIGSWMATEGKPFASQKIAEKYRKRARRWADVVALKEPDEVPVNFIGEGFILENGGIKPVDTFYHMEKNCTAVLKLYEDFDPDYSFMPMASGKAYDTLGLTLIRWPGSALPDALPDDTAFQYVEDEYMRADEYDELIGDPQGYIVKKYLPRICGGLKGLAALPHAINFVEATCFPAALTSFSKGTPARNAIECLLKAADENAKVMAPFMSTLMKLSFNYGAPANIGGISFAPYDLIGDTMRCTMGIMKDLFRQPEKVIAAAEALVPAAVEMGVQSAMATRVPFIAMPLHKGADGFMSPEQFEKFYWPSFKATLMGMIDAGLVPVPFAEGSFDQRLDIMAADPLPKGRTAWMFDRTDMKAAKEKIGDWACIGGNVPASVFKQSTAEQLEAYCRELIETCAPDGGFFLNPGAVVDQANPENVRAFLKSGHKFGKY